MKLSATDYSLLRELQQNEKHKRNYVKITVLLMLHLGKSAEEIALCLGISAATVSNYEKKYEQLGLDSYLEDIMPVITKISTDKAWSVLQEQLQGSKIKQIFLPAYSPNLNLIERLWKFMRKKVIDTHFYRTFEEFRQKIWAFFEHIEQYKQELETLISWNFHVPKTQTTFY